MGEHRLTSLQKFATYKGQEFFDRIQGRTKEVQQEKNEMGWACGAYG